ncbi:MAG: SRPBCC domain-containing protein [Sphingobacteriales bacterium]|nr:SRPBCC domain-containing protein [Sphingobacteriales bacterium]
MAVMEEKNQEKVLEMTEFFDTTAQRLFKAWTDEKDFSAWYGPEGFEVTYCKLDVKPGGKWRTCITSKEGKEYWMEGRYIEIDPPQKLVFTFGDGSENKNPDEETIVTLTFSPSGNQVKMHFHQTRISNKAVKDSLHGGWTSAWGCLRNHLNSSK